MKKTISVTIEISEREQELIEELLLSSVEHLYCCDVLNINHKDVSAIFENMRECLQSVTK